MTGGCEIRELDTDEPCGEPILVGKVCYDHAVMAPNGQPMCPITGEHSDEELPDEMYQ